MYKKHFDELNISKYLKPARVETQFNPVLFEHTWKNGHLNFFETVNFDLKTSDTIKNKVFRWAGQIDELETSDEIFHLYLLSIMPDQDSKSVKFIREFLNSKSSDKVKVEIVTPDNVTIITGDLKKEMDLHEKA